MPRVKVSEKGQITLPAALRRKMGWGAGRELHVEVGESEVVIRSLKTVAELRGIFHEYVRGRKPLSDEEETRLMEQAIAEHAANE